MNTRDDLVGESLRQVLTERRGISFASIRLVRGDGDELIDAGAQPTDMSPTPEDAWQAACGVMDRQ